MRVRCPECKAELTLTAGQYLHKRDTELAIIINCPECGHEIKVAIARANNMVGPQETKEARGE